MSNFFEQVGEFASPVKGAFDFLGPQHVEQQDPSSILGTLDTGLGNMLAESPLALLNGAVQAFNMEGSARDRLMMAGMLAVGGGMTAKRAHRAWRNMALPNVSPARAARATPGWDQLEAFGEPPRNLVRGTAAEALALSRPGLRPRQIQILSATDEIGVAEGFRRWAPTDEVNNGAAAGLVAKYAGGEDIAAAQITFARFDFAVETKVIGPSQAKGVRDAWALMIKNPEALRKNPAQVEDLFQKMRSFEQVTDGLVSDDLAVGYAGKVRNIRWNDEGEAIVEVGHPVNWGDGRITDPEVRVRRLQAMNLRVYAPEGYRNLKRLLDVALDDEAMLAKNPDAKSIFSRTLADGSETGGLKYGREWYPNALADTAEEFGIDLNNLTPRASERLDRAVASVSFLSEAEDWSNNIAKAHRVFRAIEADVADPDFQMWARDGIQLPGTKGTNNRYKYTGKEARKHAARFKEIHRDLSRSKIKVKAGELKKVLRLQGELETVQEIFATTDGQKQRNFFFNIRQPDLEYPVTIDRHAWDAFFALDSGVPKRPIDMSVEWGGENNYDVIADVYRALAVEYNMKPHQVQAIIWEAWREMKLAGPNAGWTRGKQGDPFMLLNERGVNAAYETLNGRGFLPASIESGAGPIPVDVLTAGSTDELMSTALPDGRVALTSDTNDLAATALRTMTPGVLGLDGVPRWTASRPSRYRNYKDHMGALERTDAPIDTFSLNDLARAGGHPAMRPGVFVEVTVPDSKRVRLPRLKGAGRLEPLGRTTVSEPKLRTDRLGAEDLNVSDLMGPQSPLKTHRFAVVSAALGEVPEEGAEMSQLARLDASTTSPVKAEGYTARKAHNAMGRELRAAGYKPIEAKGHYKGGYEKSWVVIGMDQRAALELGEKFGQDSVLTNDGLIYNRFDPTDPATAGRNTPTRGIEFLDGTRDEPFRTELTINKKKIEFKSDLQFGDEGPADLDPRTQRNVRRAYVQLPESANVGKYADELELRGFSDITVYSPTVEVPGWQRAYVDVGSDGSTMTVARYRDGASGAAHGSHAFVRDASGLPERPKVDKKAPRPAPVKGPGKLTYPNGLEVGTKFSGADLELGGDLFDMRLDGQAPLAFGYLDGRLTPIFDELELSSGRYGAIVRKNGTIVPSDPADVTPAVHAYQDLKPNWDGPALSMGSDGAKFGFPPPSRIGATTETITLVNEMRSPPTKADRPLPGHAEQYGFDMDPGYRIGGEARVLPDEMLARFDRVTEQFTGTHDAAIKRTRFDGVTVGESPDPDILAYFEDVPGGKIILNKDWFDNPEALTRRLEAERASGNLSPRVPATPEFLLAHEYGHVLYKALEMAEGKQNLDFVKGLNRVVGGKKWETRAAAEISETASRNHSELVAEAYSEVLGGTPSPLATQVYTYIMEQLDDRLRFLKATR